MNVVIVSGARSLVPMGLELAERRLLAALREANPPIDLSVRVVGGRSARRHASVVGGAWIPAPLGRPWRAAWRGADLVHLIGLDLPPPRSQPFVATVHDLSPVHFHDEGSLPPWAEDIADRARLILTPSAFSTDEITAHLRVSRERIRIIGGAPALDARDGEPLSVEELRELGIEPPMVLRYGGYTRRKNVSLLLAAWASVPIGTLVLAGPPQDARGPVLRAAANLGRVVVLDYVDDLLLKRLLRSSALVVSVSRYEGFGLPVLEAMAAGTPVVAVRTPFVEETCGAAAFLVDDDVEQLAAALRQLLRSPGARAELSRAGLARAQRFTWRGVAANVISAYQESLGLAAEGTAGGVV